MRRQGVIRTATFYVTGGEPFLRPDIYDLVRRITEEGGRELIVHRKGAVRARAAPEHRYCGATAVPETIGRPPARPSPRPKAMRQELRPLLDTIGRTKANLNPGLMIEGVARLLAHGA